MAISVAVVEDEKHYNNALKKIIDYDADLICVGQFFSGNEAINHLKTLEPNVVLMDIKLPDMSGIEVINKISESLPNTSFMMCTSFEDENHIFDALKVGATGYLIKGESMDKIISSIKDVYNGGAPMSFGVAKRVLQHFREDKKEISNNLNELSKSEHDILELLAQGFLYKEIAYKKEITLDTVKKHVGNIYKKLHVNNKVEAINLLKK